MFKIFSSIAIAFLGVVAVIATTPFIGYAIDGAPRRLAPSIIAVVFLIISYFIWRKAKLSSSWPVLHLTMALNFLSLILVSLSWVGVPFVDALFLIIGNLSLVFFIASLILSLVSFLLLRKSGPRQRDGADRKSVGNLIEP
jgi:hypothetical protein